jgi:rhamnopyranosyl-N-acetylglucosaminyl-diphospho-decaprenol beta-1,3/1,4-galactofuranosyltransferase
MNIAVVVVTFNRKELLQENLDALLRQSYQPDMIYIIDNNSTDGTSALLQSKGFLGKKNIVYIRLSENIGGAGGFYEGIKKAYEDGADWIWVMDDDAEPKDDALEILVKYINETSHFGALASTVVYPDGEVCLNHRKKIDTATLNETEIIKECYFKNCFEVDVVTFVGMCISRDLIGEIGFPCKDFFIYHDDFEYSLRAKTHGWSIMNVTKSVVIHKAKHREHTIRNKDFSKREFCARRNLLYIYRKYARVHIRFYWKTFMLTLRSQLSILLFNNKKVHDSRLLWFATLDGINGNFKRRV